MMQHVASQCQLTRLLVERVTFLMKLSPITDSVLMKAMLPLVGQGSSLTIALTRTFRKFFGHLSVQLNNSITSYVSCLMPKRLITETKHCAATKCLQTRTIGWRSWTTVPWSSTPRGLKTLARTSAEPKTLRVTWCPEQPTCASRALHFPPSTTDKVRYTVVYAVTSGSWNPGCSCVYDRPQQTPRAIPANPNSMNQHVTTLSVRHCDQSTRSRAPLASTRRWLENCELKKLSLWLLCSRFLPCGLIVGVVNDE